MNKNIPTLVSLKESKLILGNKLRVPETEKIPVGESLGRFAAEDFFAEFDQPEFSYSAMDGYALHSSNFAKKKADETIHLQCVTEIYAGDAREISLKKGECALISTGAKIPEGANQVVITENVRIEKNQVFICASQKNADNIRQKGSCLKKGDILSETGKYIDPIHISNLSGFGRIEVNAYQKIKVAILTTGDELVNPGEERKNGQIFNSNASLLQSLSDKKWIELILVKHLPDNSEIICRQLKKLAGTVDFLLITGGISVGKKDYIRDSLEQIGYQFLFSKMGIKPGKPFSAAVFTKGGDKTIAFALPGNPGAVYSIFSVIIAPFFFLAAGGEGTTEFFEQAIANRPIQSHPKFEVLLPVKFSENQIRPIPLNSGNLIPYSTADGIAIIPPKKNITEGEKIWYLPKRKSELPMQ